VDRKGDEAIHSDQVFHNDKLVIPGLVPGIHVFLRIKTWMAGTWARRRASRFSPAMTRWMYRAKSEMT
jgi:hypothetical protein